MDAGKVVEFLARVVIEYARYKWPRFFGTMLLTAFVTIAVGMNVQDTAWLQAWTVGAVATGLFIGAVWQWLG